MCTAPEDGAALPCPPSCLLPLLACQEAVLQPQVGLGGGATGQTLLLGCAGELTARLCLCLLGGMVPTPLVPLTASVGCLGLLNQEPNLMITGMRPGSWASPHSL
jgi:hypothetical protein